MTVADKRIERSVDSLQKIYTMVIALAIGQAISTVLIDRATYTLVPFRDMLARLPAVFSFLVVIVPFYHGMNRHLDRCYIEKQGGREAEGALLLDFAVFFFESALLFAAAVSIGSHLNAYLFLAGLLGLDMVWAFVSHLIHYRGTTPTVITWAYINAIAIAAGFLIGLHGYFSENAKAWLLLIVAILRTFSDYAWCWTFYFPDQDKSGAHLRAVEREA